MKPPVWPIPIPPWRPPCARRNRRSRIFSKSPRRQSPGTNNGSQFSGEINNTPRVVHSVKLGQTAQSDIVDWLYIENGMMRGNYTACALLKSAPKNEAEEFKKTFGLNCDL